MGHDVIMLYIRAKDTPEACKRMYNAINRLEDDKRWDYYNVEVSPRLVKSDEGKRAITRMLCECTETFKMNIEHEKPEWVCVVDGHN